MKQRIIEEDLCAIVCKETARHFAGKRVLVTGAGGMIPYYIVRSFLAMNDLYGAGLHVTGVARSRERTEAKYGGLLARPDLSMIYQDVCDPLSLPIGPDSIVHAASNASPKQYGTEPDGTIDANVLGTRRLLELAKDTHAADFLFVSTGEVYGVPPGDHAISENDYGYVDILNVRSCYAESKRLAETMCVAWHHQYGVPARLARVFHTYGPGLRSDDGRVFADFAANIARSENIVMYSDGSAKRPFCYLSDCVRALLLTMVKGNDAEAYNIANMDMYRSMYELALELTSLYPEMGLTVERRIRTDGYLPSPLQEMRVDTSKIESLGWKPRISIRQGFLRTIESFHDEERRHPHA